MKSISVRPFVVETVFSEIEKKQASNSWHYDNIFVVVPLHPKILVL